MHGEPPLLIQCATPMEFEALRQAVGNVEIEKAGKRRFFQAFYGPNKTHLIVLRGSVGKVWSAATAEFAIGRWAPKLIVDFGAAGGLASDLCSGDLIFADKVIEHDVCAVKGNVPEVVIKTEVFAPTYPEFKILSDGRRVTRGHLASGDQDVQSATDRAALVEKFKLNYSLIAVSWESAAIGRVCGFHGVSFLSARVITDLGTGDFLEEYRKGATQFLLPTAKAVVEFLALSLKL